MCYAHKTTCCLYALYVIVAATEVIKTLTIFQCAKQSVRNNVKKYVSFMSLK